MSSEIYKSVSLPENYEVNIVNNIDDDYVLNKLPVPTGLLNNFIKNSLEHGTADQKQSRITITISCVKSRLGYLIIVEDNGCGIKYSKSIQGTKNGKGIELAKETIEIFNKINKEYRIKFSPHKNIFDNQNTAKGCGTTVFLEFSKK